MIFEKKKERQVLQFGSRAEAFSYMLAYQTEKGADPMTAAKKANEFAEIFAKNSGIPDTPEPELKGVDKYISMAEKIGNYIETHPKIVEYGVPALTFIVGLFTGKKVENNQQQQEQAAEMRRDDIDFDKIPD